MFALQSILLAALIRGPVPYRVLDAGHHALLPPFLDNLQFVDQETQVVVRVLMFPQFLGLGQISLKQVVICGQKMMRRLKKILHVLFFS